MLHLVGLCVEVAGGLYIYDITVYIAERGAGGMYNTTMGCAVKNLLIKP